MLSFNNFLDEDDEGPPARERDPESTMEGMEPVRLSPPPGRGCRAAACFRRPASLHACIADSATAPPLRRARDSVTPSVVHLRRICVCPCRVGSGASTC